MLVHCISFNLFGKYFVFTNFVKECFWFFHLEKDFNEHECVKSVKQCMYECLGLAQEKCLNGVLGQANVATL